MQSDIDWGRNWEMLEKVSKSNKTGTAAKVSEILDWAESEVTEMKKLNSLLPLHLHHEQNQLPKRIVMRPHRNLLLTCLERDRHFLASTTKETVMNAQNLVMPIWYHKNWTTSILCFLDKWLFALLYECNCLYVIKKPFNLIHTKIPNFKEPNQM